MTRRYFLINILCLFPVRFYGFSNVNYYATTDTIPAHFYPGSVTALDPQAIIVPAKWAG